MVPARNAWDHDYPFWRTHIKKGKEKRKAYIYKVSLLKQAQLKNKSKIYAIFAKMSIF